jgi:hypothetical protein
VRKKMIDFNKAAYENAFKNVNMLQESMEQAIHHYIDKASGMSENSKKSANEWVSMHKKGYEYFKKLVDDDFKKMGGKVAADSGIRTIMHPTMSLEVVS